MIRKLLIVLLVILHMAAKLAIFLLDLAEDSELRKSLAKDPEKTMTDAGLTTAEKDAIRKKDVNEINSLAFPTTSSEPESFAPHNIKWTITISGTHDWFNVVEE
jgi:hypothetical protein